MASLTVYAAVVVHLQATAGFVRALRACMLTAGRSLPCLIPAGANSRPRPAAVRQHCSTHGSKPDLRPKSGRLQTLPTYQPVGLRLQGAHRRRHRRSAAQGGSSGAPAREQLALSLNDYWTASIAQADVLIIDATNRAVVSAADARAYAHVGATLPATFAAWLAYLRELLQPTLCIAVFDVPRVRCLHPSRQPSESRGGRPCMSAREAAKTCGLLLLSCRGCLCDDTYTCVLQGTTASRRQHAVPDYLRKRHEKLQERQTGAQPALSQQTQRTRQGRRSRLHDVAEAAGCVVAVASHGWEADDVIGALCAAADAASLTGWLGQQFTQVPQLQHSIATRAWSAEPHSEDCTLACVQPRRTGSGDHRLWWRAPIRISSPC